MEKLKKIPQYRINKIRRNPEQSGLNFKLHGKSADIDDYTDREIIEMLYGIFKYRKFLLVDGDYFINLEDVVKSECILADVSYVRKPTLNDLRNNSHNTIDNISQFYVEDYFLITKNPTGGLTRHKITRYLNKIGCLPKGRGRNLRFYTISNDYQLIQKGYPEDLFHPIKKYVNGLFFKDDYKIHHFEVISNIQISARSNGEL